VFPRPPLSVTKALVDPDSVPVAKVLIPLPSSGAPDVNVPAPEPPFCTERTVPTQLELLIVFKKARALKGTPLDAVQVMFGLVKEQSPPRAMLPTVEEEA
jgi:hypothetical protein